MANVDGDFFDRIKDLQRRVEHQQMVAIGVIASELLRLSQLEVPFRSGHLLSTGTTDEQKDEWLVGYNTPYAARMHEHPEYHFRNGRKGKYLEDPMKMNLPVFHKFFDEKMGEVYA